MPKKIPVTIIKWNVNIEIINHYCPYRNIISGRCIDLPIGNDECTFENCKRKTIKTCLECELLRRVVSYSDKYPNGFLISSCGDCQNKEIHASQTLNEKHYKIPKWCPRGHYNETKEK